MPYGLTNAPTVFMDIMNQVCKPYLDKFIIVFIDDLLIYSKTMKDHEVHLKLVLELLKKERLYAKFSMCEFWLQEVHFLAYVVNHNDIYMDPSEASKVENATAEMLHGKDQLMEKKEDEVWVPLIGDVRTLIMDEAHASRYLVHLGANKTYHDLRDMYWWLGMKRDITMYVSRCLTCLKAKIKESRLIGPELVQETTDKSLRLGSSVTEGIALEKNDTFWKKCKLAPRYVGPFEILKRVGPVAYRLRLPKELSSVHDTFHVSNLKKCLVDENLHLPLDEIKVDKTLHLVKVPIEIMNCEVKSLKRGKIPTVMVCKNSKRGPEFM
nr:putative reverse transcriptase domain-containing protein [Tanacetum cinerariifolium]